MKEIERTNCILVNTDCVSEIQNFDGKTMRVTLRGGEHMIIPAVTFGGCVPFTSLPQIIPSCRMFALINNGMGVKRYPVQLVTVTKGVLQPMCIDMGKISYPVGMDGYVGMEIGSDLSVSREKIKI